MILLRDIQQYLNLKYIIIFSSGVLCLKILFSSKVKDVVYAMILNRLAKSLDKSKYYNKIKGEIFSPLIKLPEKETSKVKIVEIGAGSGANFKFYPDNSEITCLEPNDQFNTYLLSNCPQKFKDSIQFVIAKAENIESVESNSMDAVVSTLVLCSVGNQEKAVNEVKRILKPGGSFYFYEHVKASGGVTSLFQIILEPVWWFLSECRTRSNTKKIINNAGFSKTSIIDCQLPVFNYMFFLKPAIAGTATK